MVSQWARDLCISHAAASFLPTAFPATVANWRWFGLCKFSNSKTCELADNSQQASQSAIMRIGYNAPVTVSTPITYSSIHSMLYVIFLFCNSIESIRLQFKVSTKLHTIRKLKHLHSQNCEALLDLSCARYLFIDGQTNTNRSSQ